MGYKGDEVMREIIYRGKVVDTGVWVEGDLIQEDGFYFIRYRRDLPWVEVIPESVGVFTGKYSIDGKRIYEGDIVTLDNFPGLIRWDEEMCCLRIQYEEAGDESLDEIFGDELIIDNIFDNPTYFKGGEERLPELERDWELSKFIQGLKKP